MTQPVPAAPPPDLVPAYGPDNEAVMVPANELAARVRSGEVTLGVDQTIEMVSPVNGKVEQVSAQDAMRRMAGFERTAGPGAFARQQEAQDYDNPLVAGALGFSRAATFGLSDQFAAAVDAGNAEKLEKFRRNNEIGSAAGEGLGMLAPIGVGGGASLLGRGGGSLARAGLEGATLLPRGVAALGGAAERATLGALESAGATGWAGRAAASAVGAGTEGALYGLGSAISESAITNHELTGESVIAALGHGALLGAAAGGGLSALGSLARGVGRRGQDTITGLFERNTPEALRGAKAALEGGMTPALTDKTAETYIKLVAKGDEAQALRLRDAWRDRAKLIGSADDTLEGAQRSMRKDTDALDSASHVFTDEAKGKLKIEQVKKAIKTGNEEEALSFVSAKLDDVKAKLGEMLADKSGIVYGQQANLAKLRQVVNHVETGIARGLGTESQNAIAFAELDLLKRKLGRASRPGQMASDTADASTNVLRDMYEGLRTDLENVNMWGKAAEQQRDINRAWSKQIETGKRYQTMFGTDIGRMESDAFQTKFGMDPAKLSGYVNSFGKAANDLRHETLTAHVKNTKELIDTISNHYDLGHKAGDLKKAHEAVAGFEKTIGHVEKEVGSTNALKRLQEEEKAHSFGSGVVGYAVDGALRPVATLSRLAELEQMTAKVKARMGDGISGLLERGKAGAKAAGNALGSAASATGAMARKMAAPVVIEADNVARRATARQPVETQYKERREVLANYQATEPAKLAGIAKRLEGAPPETIAATQAGVAKGQQFLQSKVPVVAKQESLTPQFDNTNPSPAQMATFLRYARAVEDPLSVIADARKGAITREGAETLRSVYPELYSQVQGEIQARVSELQKPLSYAQKTQLAVLLDVVADPSLKPENIKRQQDAYAQQGSAAGVPGAPAAKSGPAPKPVDIAGAFATKADSLARAQGT